MKGADKYENSKTNYLSNIPEGDSEIALPTWRKTMFNKLYGYATKPELYTPSTGKFWDDEHISKGMLEAHLNPNWDAATRNHDFLDKSVKWISETAPPSNYKCLLDLGCGPGLYAERFCAAGYSVTGIDCSKRSISYAKEQAATRSSNITYLYQDYLTIDYFEQFDLITLIYCDYAPLSKTNRQTLLSLIHQALKQNGKFIFDVFTPKMRKPENRSWHYSASGGFWSESAHLCLESVYQYDDDDKTELCQTIVCTSEAVNCYNIWDHFFTKESLISETQSIGFRGYEFFSDVAGAVYSAASETICVVLTK
jgi:SAM-dependent methyltransferase